MEVLFFIQRSYFCQIITKTMSAHTIEKHDIQSSSSHVDNLISSLPIGNCNTSITVYVQEYVCYNLYLAICDLVSSAQDIILN